jgi:hypothetical protein
MALADVKEIEYDYKPHEVAPIFTASRNGVASLKCYSMRPVGTPHFSRDFLFEVSSTLFRRMEMGEIKPRLGYGFVIVSDGVINANMWGGTFPSLPVPSIYSFKGERDVERNMERLGLDAEGVYCVWEAEVFAHEARAWRELLSTPKSERDAKKYLRDCFSGTIL